MADSTLDYTGEEPPQTGKGKGVGSLGPSDSSDSGSDVVGAPGMRDDIDAGTASCRSTATTSRSPTRACSMTKIRLRRNARATARGTTAQTWQAPVGREVQASLSSVPVASASR